MTERKFVCGLPPSGWTCSRDPGHEGPCAASPLRAEVLKAKYIQCESYTDYTQCFGLYKEQSVAIGKWMDEHDKERHIKPVSEGGKGFRYDGAIGGGYTYQFTRTSLGVCVHVRCTCGESIDVSDYDTW